MIQAAQGAEAQGGNALDSIFGTLDRIGGYFFADKAAQRRDNAAARAAQREILAGTSNRVVAKTPLSPQTLAAYAAVAMVLVTVFGLTLRFINGRG